MIVSFSDKESEYLKRIAELYDSVKTLVLYAEEIDPENRTHPQVLKEFRDALEHIIRVIAHKVGLKSSDVVDYQEKNLDKAYGHVYRAAYDTLDWVSILLRRKISEELKGYSASAINASLPNYYSKIRPRIEGEIPINIARVRGIKDIGSPSLEAIEEYLDLAEELKKYYEAVTKAKAGLISYAKDERRDKCKDILLRDVLMALGVGVVVGIIVWLFT
jgi:hypothetical protein